MRALLAGEAEGVGAGAGGTDSSGDIRGEGDSSSVTEGLGVGVSCAAATDAKAVIRNAKLALFVMSSGVETSLIFLKNVERFLDFARNDKALNIVAPVQIRKQVVAAFAVMQEVIVDVICDKLIV